MKCKVGDQELMAVAVIVEISVTVSDVEEMVKMVEELVGIQVEGTQRQELSEGSMLGPLEPPPFL